MGNDSTAVIREFGWDPTMTLAECVPRLALGSMDRAGVIRATTAMGLRLHALEEQPVGLRTDYLHPAAVLWTRKKSNAGRIKILHI